MTAEPTPIDPLAPAETPGDAWDSDRGRARPGSVCPPPGPAGGGGEPTEPAGGGEGTGPRPVPDPPRVVYAFAKNTREEVRATLTGFRGWPVADFRVWINDRATPKGLTVRPEMLGELRRAVEAAERAWREWTEQA